MNETTRTMLIVTRLKSTTVAYVLWLFGLHHLYFRRPGTWLLYYFLWIAGWLTMILLPIVVIWAFIDLFRIPAMVDEWNDELMNGPRPAKAAEAGKAAKGRGLENLVLSVLMLLLGFGIAWVKREEITRWIERHTPPAETQVATAGASPAIAPATPLPQRPAYQPTPAPRQGAWMWKGYRPALDPPRR